MSAELIRVAVNLDAGQGANAQELEQATVLLRRQLLQLDVSAVDRITSEEAPDGTRAVEVAVLGTLLVTLTKSPELLKVLIGTIQSWLATHQGRSVEIQMKGDTLKVSGVSSVQQQQLISLFVERHSA